VQLGVASRRDLYVDVSLAPSLTRVRILSYLFVLPMDHYRSNGRYRLFLPYAHDLLYSLLVCSSTIQRGPFSCVIPSVSPIDDGLSVEISSLG